MIYLEVPAGVILTHMVFYRFCEDKHLAKAVLTFLSEQNNCNTRKYLQETIVFVLMAVIPSLMFVTRQRMFTKTIESKYWCDLFVDVFDVHNRAIQFFHEKAVRFCEQQNLKLL